MGYYLDEALLAEIVPGQPTPPPGATPKPLILMSLESTSGGTLGYLLAALSGDRLPSVAGTGDRGYPLAGVGIGPLADPIPGRRSPVPAPRGRTTRLACATPGASPAVGPVNLPARISALTLCASIMYSDLVILFIIAPIGLSPQTGV